VQVVQICDGLAAVNNIELTPVASVVAGARGWWLLAWYLGTWGPSHQRASAGRHATLPRSSATTGPGTQTCSHSQTGVVVSDS
jgi:hypothetical protein